MSGRARVLAAAFFGAVALAATTAAAQDADRSATFAAELAKVAWQPISTPIQRLIVRQPPLLELVAYRFPSPSFMPAVVPALDAKGSTATDILDDIDTAVLVINGGYFDRVQDGTLKPTGLLIAGGKTISPSTACRACSGVLWVKDGGLLKIDWAKDVVPDSSFDSAVQTGPLLVEPGGKLGIAKPGGPKAERSAICLTKTDPEGLYPNVTVVAVTSRITLYEFAVLLKRPSPGGFGCERAINLDGGPSTQVAARFGNFIVRQESYGTASPVQNFIAFYGPK